MEGEIMLTKTQTQFEYSWPENKEMIAYIYVRNGEFERYEIKQGISIGKTLESVRFIHDLSEEILKLCGVVHIKDSEIFFNKCDLPSVSDVVENREAEEKLVGFLTKVNLETFKTGKLTSVKGIAIALLETFPEISQHIERIK